MKFSFGVVTIAASNIVSRSNATPIEERQATSYDYVIIGGGTAGLTLAARLTGNPAISVAVMEVGTFYQAHRIYITNPLFSSTPARYSFYSARNFLIYQRGARESYAKWTNGVGDQSYTFDALLPYFKKSIKFTAPPSARAANASAEYNPGAFSAARGPLQASYANYARPFLSYIEASLNKIGIQDVLDFNSGSLFGAQYCSSTIDPSNEKRDSSQTSFLGDAESRSNLKAFGVTTAQQIIFDDTKTTTGVLVKGLNFIPFTVSARKGAILSARAFQSPHLLMLSGICHAATLAKFNIPLLKDAPGVGQNMWDHVFFGPSYRVKVQTFTRLVNDLLYTIGQYFAALRSAFPPAALADLAYFPSDWPEIEYLSAPGFVGDFGSLPLDQPKDGYRYATILAAIRVRQVFASNYMKPVLIGGEYFPGPAVQTDAQILATIQKTVHTVWHASYTNKMGFSTDPMAVIDSNTRVFGVNNLRVVDSSSFPILPPGHPQSTVYALTEKIAAQILAGNWGPRERVLYN
ncbi:hypothetical protein B0J14DRAFT_615670 [Halenospora varia]|nr:hypothetical protein B0J14DRAFT_615670 [Halenospora varia]